MAIQAEAVDILVRKSRFEPDVALGVAEAIGVSITLAQLVTVPVLDARLREITAEIKAEIKTETQTLRSEFHVAMEKTKAELVRWVFLTMLGNVALGAFASQVLKAFAN